MKNKHLLEIELFDEVPDITGAYSWWKIKKCPKDGDLYQDFCMDYGCPYMSRGDCVHTDMEIVREGYKKS